MNTAGLTPTPATARGLGGLAAPRAMYALGFLCVTALLWIRFNPTFGNKTYGEQQSPMQAFRDAAGNFAWGWEPAHRAIVFLSVLVLGYLVLCFVKPGRGRGLAACALGLLAYLSIPPQAEDLETMILFVASAGMVGAILASAPATLWSRRVFWMCFLTLAAILWMPNSLDKVPVGDYESLATSLIDDYADPPATFSGRTLGDAERYGYLALNRMPETLAAALFLVGVLFAFGVRGRWLHIVTFVLFGLQIFGLSIAYAVNCGFLKTEAELTSVQNALYGLGHLWFAQFVPFAWPFAAGVREATGE